MTTIEEIESFLRKAKSLIRQGRWTFVPRKKNLDGLAELGITIHQAKMEILALTYRHYERGPIGDRDAEGDLWEFIKEFEATPIYIKLKIDDRGCVCISFHLAIGPTSLPYRDWQNS